MAYLYNGYKATSRERGIVSMDKLTPEQRRKNMQAIKNKDSKIELLIRKKLWERGLRYRKNVASVYGHPDIAFLGKRIAIFCDSEFWHGYNWEKRKVDIKTNVDFWTAKIERNMARDEKVNNYLTLNGWIVLRFWGRDIQKNLEACVNEIVGVTEGNYGLCIGRIFML